MLEESVEFSGPHKSTVPLSLTQFLSEWNTNYIFGLRN